jgi:hypothetical protein
LHLADTSAREGNVIGWVGKEKGKPDKLWHLPLGNGDFGLFGFMNLIDMDNLSARAGMQDNPFTASQANRVRNPQLWNSGSGMDCPIRGDILTRQ